MKLKQHPLSAAFPPMSADDREALLDDIEVHGQRVPIVTHDGMVLEGWHRYECVMELRRAPNLVELAEDEDPVTFVLSHNLHRRHLTASQRAVVVVKCAEWHPPHRVKKVELSSTLSTNAQMAEAAKTDPRTIRDAKKVVAAGREDEVNEGASVKSIARPEAPKKPILPQVEEEKDDADLEEWKLRAEAGQIEIKERDELIARLCKDDATAEAALAVQQYNHANGRIAQLNRTESVMKKQLDYRGRILAEVRKLLGVEKDSQIVAAILAMKKGANDF